MGRVGAAAAFTAINPDLLVSATDDTGGYPPNTALLPLYLLDPTN
jgi:hypothetical protein